MKKLIILSLLLSSALALKAQYTFKVLVSNGNPYERCEESLFTYEFTYTGNNKPDSVFLFMNGKKAIDTDDWSFSNNKYSISRFLSAGVYNPILYMYKAGALTRFVLPKPIIVYHTPKAVFSVETDTISCKSKVVLCLKDKSETGADNNALEKIEIDWGNGKTTQGIIGGNSCMTYVTNGYKNIAFTIIDNKGCFSTLVIPNYFNVENELPLALNYNNLALDSATQFGGLSLKLDASKSVDSLVELKTELTQLVNAYGTKDDINEAKTFKLGSNGFVDTAQGLLFNLPAGKYEVITSGKTLSGCTGSVKEEIIIGHLTGLSANGTCFGQATTFTDSVYYWNNKGQAYCNLVNWTENSSCIDTNSFFYSPDTVRHRLYGQFPSYTKPKYKERIAWDFEDDGKIDIWDVHNPNHIYANTGTFNCAMWTMDSTGVWQKSTTKVEIKDHDFKISVSDPNGKICLPQEVIFSVYDKINNTKVEDLYLNGTVIPAVFGERSLYLYNTIDKLNFSILTEDGCFIDSVEAPKMNIIGAKTDFKIMSDSILCSGDVLAYENLSDSGKYDWKVTEYPRGNPSNDRNFYIKDQKDLLFDNLYPGRWVVKLTTTVEYFDNSTNQTLTCRTSKTNGFYHEVRRGFKTDFKIDSLLGNATVRFMSTDSIANNVDYYYSVNDGEKVKIDTFEGNDRRYKTFTIQFPSIDKYKVCLYGYRDVCADSTCKTFWINSVGVNENPLSNIALYPNPTSANTNLTFPYHSGNFRILDFTGRAISKGNLVEGINEISLANLPKGVYMLEIRHEQHVLQKRLIKN